MVVPCFVWASVYRHLHPSLVVIRYISLQTVTDSFDLLVPHYHTQKETQSHRGPAFYEAPGKRRSVSRGGVRVAQTLSSFPMWPVSVEGTHRTGLCPCPATDRLWPSLRHTFPLYQPQMLGRRSQGPKVPSNASIPKVHDSSWHPLLTGWLWRCCSWYAQRVAVNALKGKGYPEGLLISPCVRIMTPHDFITPGILLLWRA